MIWPFQSQANVPSDIPSRMKRWTTKGDGLDKLSLGESDVPSPSDGEVLVRISAVSLNYRDLEVCTGEYRDMEVCTGESALVPCSDMCGTVIISNSPRFKPGARVIATFNQTHLTGASPREEDMASGLGFPLSGVLAQYRCFPGDGLVPVPGYLSDQEAACLPIAALTAWMSINGARPLGSPLDASSKKTVLLQGTGGVSVAGLQIAHAAGLKTIVTSSSDEKLKRAGEMGAAHRINYRTHWEWQEPVMEATGQAGADIILEVGGMRTLRRSFECVAFGGVINCIGYVSGKGEEADGEQEGRVNVNVLAVRRGVTLRGILNGPRDRLEEMVGWFEKKGIRPVVGKSFGFEEARDAFGYLKKGGHFGKVVIQVA